jgi:hypothetical protein
MTTESSSLDEIVDQVSAFARERNIALMPGFAPEQEAGVPVIHHTTSQPGVTAPGDSARRFTEALERLDVALIAIQVLQFTEHRWRSAVELIQSGIDLHRRRGNQAARAALDSVLAEARAARRHIGTTATIAITVITRNPTIMIEWVEMPAWHRSIADAEDTIVAEAEYDEPDLDNDDNLTGGPDEPPPPPPFGGRRARRTH